jgi:hypothetical protein
MINCYMNLDSTARFVGALLDRVDDFISELRTRMVATQLIRSVAVTAAKYRASKSNRRRISVASRMCLVLDEADHSVVWHQRIAHQRLSRRLELVRQTLCVADEIIENTLSSERTVQRSRGRCQCQWPVVSSYFGRSNPP